MNIQYKHWNILAFSTKLVCCIERKFLMDLDKQLDLKLGLNREQLFDAIADCVIEQTRLVGVYER